jgi:CDP-paratose 2-epimerase
MVSGSKQKSVLITGCNGLVGSACVRRLLDDGWLVWGIDNDMRGQLFGEDASTKDVLEDVLLNDNFCFKNLDVRKPFTFDKKFDLIIHCSAQPSHELANTNPQLDFEINVQGTLNVLEYARLKSPDSIFIHLSTTKVYGDIVNELHNKLIDESIDIQQGIHSIFGISKACGDLYVQEYGKYFGLKTVILRPGCITGKDHKGTRMHGFLSYLVKCVKEEITYNIEGFGEQVRDQIHVEDLVDLIMMMYEKPPKSGEVYNVGGGILNSISVNNAIDRICEKLDKVLMCKLVDGRVGDHQYNVHDLSKVQAHYPEWKIKRNLDYILNELCGKN